MGFSADWLSLREPADAAARDATLLSQAASAAGRRPIVLDLGCGTGSTMRAMRRHLCADTRWRLVDNDPDLLRHATAGLPDTAAEPIVADLGDVEALPLDNVSLVTASALLDLVSEAWVAALAARLQTPFYAALSYDGVMSWSPEDPADDDVTAAFNAHQKTDKGLGAALGPSAAARAEAIFSEAGFEVTRAPSPWRLGPDMHALQAELTDGIAGAASEAGLTDAAAWGQRRRDAAHRTQCWVGHEDLLATPRGSGNGARHAAD